jgi:transcriptional regulator with XRE-family HTH domain
VDDRRQDRTGHGRRCLSAPGVVAGAVLRSARLSAGVSKATLAAASGVTEDTIWSWQGGSSSLAEVPLPRVQVLEAALMVAGADPRLVADLGAAAWCDLLIVALAGCEDTACLTADPVAGTDTFRELLAWSAAGHVPARYRPYAAPRRLLTDATVIDRVARLLDAMPAQLAAAGGSAV